MYQLFIFFMVTDPKTTVGPRRAQIVVVFIVAFVEMLLRLAEVVYAPFYALFLVGPVSLFIESLLAAKPQRSSSASTSPAVASKLRRVREQILRQHRIPVPAGRVAQAGDVERLDGPIDPVKQRLARAARREWRRPPPRRRAAPGRSTGARTAGSRAQDRGRPSRRAVSL